MSDKPISIKIRCQGCDVQFTPKQLVSARGICVNCPQANWHVQAEYLIHENKGSPVAAKIGLNAIGLGLLATTGTGFVVGLGGIENNTATGATSIANIYDVSGTELLAVCDPVKTAMTQLAEFVRQREQEIQRSRILERGGSHCLSCKILFVPSPSKPWTMVGTCSRSCCAALHGEQDYSLVESAVNAATAKEKATTEQSTKDKAFVQVRCTCGVIVQLAKMYQGTFRKCPCCQSKILVPSSSTV
jgi:hypothetical protein